MMYAVYEGTNGILVTHHTDGRETEAKEVTTNKDQLFNEDELVVDPSVAYENPSRIDSIETDLAWQGYSVFTSRKTPRYSLAVKSEDIEVA